MKVTTIGARPFRPRKPRNAEQWQKICAGHKYDRQTAELSAEVEDLQRDGVDPAFIRYAIRLGCLASKN